MGYRIAVRNGDFGAIFASAAKESSNYAFLVCRSSEGVVDNGENGLDRTLAVLSVPADCLWAYLWLHDDADGSRGGLLSAGSDGTERPGQMEERVWVRHGGQFV